MKYVLALDQGTTSSRAIIYNESFEVMGVGQKEYPQYYPKPDWVEHDLNEIWESIESSVKEALNKAGSVRAEDISCIGITNQRETFGVWNKNTLMPYHRAIVWQCRRSTDICQKLSRSSAGRNLKKITGLVMDPYFSGTKLTWLLKNNKEIAAAAKKGEACFGTIDTFLVAKLTAGRSFVTDTSNASRTMLMDLKTCTWSAVALKTLGVPRTMLPEIKASNSKFGVTQGLEFLPNGIPIYGILGDQQSALFGQACFNPGEAKVTYGTGAFLLLNTGDKIKRSKSGLSTVAWTIGNKTTYAVEGSVFIAGAAVQWLRDNLGILKSSADIETLAEGVSSSDGVYFIPALSGLGSPYWSPESKGIIGGLTRRSKKEHIARACLEAIAQSVADQFDSITADAKIKLRGLKVDGGASRNKILLGLQADLLQTQVHRPKDIESTARGAAYMAALGAGIYTDKKQLAGLNPVDLSVAAKIKKSVSLKERQLWKKRVALLVKATPIL